MIEVHFLSYANPRQTDHQNRCCSGQVVQGRCSLPCWTFFKACVGFLNNIQGCFLGMKSSGILGNSSFVIPSNSLLQIPWQSIQSWPVRINQSLLNLSSNGYYFLRLFLFFFPVPPVRLIVLLYPNTELAGRVVLACKTENPSSFWISWTTLPNYFSSTL